MRNAGVLFAALWIFGCAEPNQAGPDKIVPRGPSCGHGALDNDPLNCGECGFDCTKLPGVVGERARCVQGICDVRAACGDGFVPSPEGDQCLSTDPPTMPMPSPTPSPSTPPMPSNPPLPTMPTPTAWAVETSSTTSTLYGIWGQSDGTRWAVGAGGTVLKGARGAAFSTVPTANTNEHYGVWGSTNGPLAAGWMSNIDSGAFFGLDTAGAWKGQRLVPVAFNAVWGTSPSNVYFVGERGTILRWDAGLFILEDSASTAQLSSVWGSGPEDVYAVGSGGVILWSDGSGEWIRLRSGVTVELMSIWGASETDLWVVGRAGTVLHSNGTGAFTKETTPVTDDLLGVFGLSATEIYAVGDKGVILRSTGGGSWTVEDSKTTAPLWSLWGSATDGLWAVGKNGTIVHKQ